MLIIIFIILPIFLRSRKETRNRNNNTSSLQDEVVNVSVRHLANNHSNESVKCGGTAVYEDFDTKDPLHSIPFKVIIKNKVSSMEPQSRKRKHSNYDSSRTNFSSSHNHNHANLNKTDHRPEKHQRVKSWGPEMAGGEAPFPMNDRNLSTTLAPHSKELHLDITRIIFMV